MAVRRPSRADSDAPDGAVVDVVARAKMGVEQAASAESKPEGVGSAAVRQAAQPERVGSGGAERPAESSAVFDMSARGARAHF